jgi:endonuclease/exonuclease/phosphatase family metal-dependent hydrolase
MKIIFLNTWEGKQANAISDFLEAHKTDTDIFCLQEVYGNMRKLAKNHLHDFNEIYKHQDGPEFETGIEDYAQAIYVRKNIKVLKSEEIFEDSTKAGLGLAIDVELNGKILHILNYHGISRPKDKLDNDVRLDQSIKIIDYYKDLLGCKILGGDFNFLPETESYNIFIKNGYKELVKSSNTPTTRNRLFWDNRPQKHLFSDYIFISHDIAPKGFQVPNIEISDHLPLILEI